MLEVKNLSKQFAEHTAVEDISFTVNAGEVFCLLGANGAGKTTTLVEDYRQQRLKALQLQQAFLWSSPVLNLQALLNRLAGNDTLAHQAFLDQVIAYHDELRDFYYPFLFHDASFSEADFTRIPTFVYQAPKQSFLLIGLTQFALGFVLLFGLLLSRRKHWLESDL